MNDAARLALDGLEIGGIVVARDVGVFAVGTVVEELADLDALDEFRHAANVIGMVVGDEHMIDVRDAGVFHCRLDAIGVAAVVAGPAGIDEQGRAGRRNEQRGLAAFDVDGIDEQVLCGFGLRHVRADGAATKSSAESAEGEHEQKRQEIAEAEGTKHEKRE